MPRRYPAEFRRKVLDLVAAGRPVAQVAHDLHTALDDYSRLAYTEILAEETKDTAAALLTRAAA